MNIEDLDEKALNAAEQIFHNQLRLGDRIFEPNEFMALVNNHKIATANILKRFYSEGYKEAYNQYQKQGQ